LTLFHSPEVQPDVTGRDAGFAESLIAAEPGCAKR
jgi:hypothetical protein